MSAVDPRYLNVLDWANLALPGLSKYGRIPVLSDAAAWHQWAYDLIQLPKIARYAPPQPDLFPSWEEWAFRFNQAVPQ